MLYSGKQNSPLPIDEYEALLFDLDGTLADSMGLHNRAWIETLREFGLKMTEEILMEYTGIPNFKTVEIFNQRFGWTLDPRTVALKKENRFFEDFDQMPAVEPVLKIAKEYFNKKPMAIVSGGSREVVSRILTNLKIEHLFSAKVCSEDTLHGKPSPEPFLLAAKLLGLPAPRCLVFEDGSAGILGAQACGMGVVKVSPDFTLNFLEV
jgi:HAD superfamily hydrolase (TIGR01509 family)